MAACCWGCKMKVAPVGAEWSELPLNPLGACHACHVFGCRAHAHWDRLDAQWLCSFSAAVALAAQSGLEDGLRVSVQFADSADFDRRLPELAHAAEAHRQYWLAGPGEPRLADVLREEDLRERVNRRLAADALGVAAFLTGREADPFQEMMRAAEGLDPSLLPPRIASLLGAPPLIEPING